MMSTKSTYLSAVAILIVGAIVYMLDPTLGGMIRGPMKVLPSRIPEGFTDVPSGVAAPAEPVGYLEDDGDVADKYSSVAKFDETINPTGDSGNQQPNGCFPRKQLTPSELLPKDNNTLWAQMNPGTSGDLVGVSLSAAGSHLGIRTQGSSNRNPNLQLRPDPVIPQVAVGPWNQSTIQPDTMRRGFELN